MRWTAVSLFAAAVALAAIGVACTDDRATQEELKALHEFDEFPVYWAGEEFRGLPLSRVMIAGDGADVYLMYGSCEPRSDAGCAPPLAIETRRSCMVSVAATPTVVRGTSAFDTPHLVIHTGGVAVTIYADEPLESDAAEAIVAANAARFPDHGAIAAGDPLLASHCAPAPTPSAGANG
jgi:hypothetical protein